jgi:tRNA modification GTPase
VLAADGALLDDALLAWFPAPFSYTGNDLVEFQCHGSPAVVAALIEALCREGARLARPGEFTERAFFNGQLDLAQAEAVANLIASRTREASRVALSQLEGSLSKAVNSIREALLDLAAEIEARLDFPEEEIETSDRNRLIAAFEDARTSLCRLLDTARRGRLFRDGARVALAGRPNTGKSSLLNALVGMERALVTPHPGTTRDTIAATVDIPGMPIVLIDTAGVRHEGVEEIESLGIERTLREVRSADLVLLVLDASSPFTGKIGHSSRCSAMKPPFWRFLISATWQPMEQTAPSESWNWGCPTRSRPCRSVRSTRARCARWKAPWPTI